ncbi:MAG: TetR/AcrR family transcriptional regulator [Planctomycetota bacterium]|jgi:AcrR family transcriptional regulator
MRAPLRRRKLLDAALPCFARRGYRGTTTAQLAEAAGITPPILYRHFASKLDLFSNLLDEAAGRVVESWRTRLNGIADSRLRAAALVDAVSRPWRQADQRLILRALSEAEDDPAIARRVRACLRTIHGFVAAELKTLQAAGVVRDDVVARQLAQRLVSAAVGVAITSTRAARHPRPDPARWIETLVAARDRRPAGSAGKRGSPTSGR